LILFPFLEGLDFCAEGDAELDVDDGDTSDDHIEKDHLS
jgi:hypothetical protein